MGSPDLSQRLALTQYDRWVVTRPCVSYAALRPSRPERISHSSTVRRDDGAVHRRVRVARQEHDERRQDLFRLDCANQHVGRK